MKTLVKKTMGLLMAALVAFGVMAGTTQAFAAEGQLVYKVDSQLNVSGSFFLKKITGTVDVSKTVTASPVTQIEGQKDSYTGTISASVEAADLFEGAYKVYEKEIKGQGFGPWKFENIIMSSEGEKFPIAQYTVKFPSNFHVDKKGIKATENSSTISGIEAKYVEKDNSVVITIQLGNWNDYKEFFKLVESERNQTGHEINVNIPYTVEGKEELLGTITGSGICQLYKFGNHPISDPIVNITSPLKSLEIKRL